MRPVFAFLLLLLFSTAGAQTTLLPDFHFAAPGGKMFGRKDLKPSSPVIVFYFDPECEHCQAQAGWVSESLARFSDVQLVWVAAIAPMEKIQEFRQKYFAGASNVFFLRDNDYLFDKYFGYSTVPSIFVYNRLGVKVKEFRNEISVDDLLAPLGTSK